MSNSYSGRTVLERRAQECVEASPQFFSKQLQGEAFTEEEAVEIADCALLNQQESQVRQDTVGWIAVGILGPIAIA